MKDHLSALVTWLGTFSADNSSLLLGDRYWLTAAQRLDALPYIVYLLILDSPDLQQANYADDANGIEFLIQFHCWGTSASEAVTVADALADDLRSVPLEVPGWSIFRSPQKEFGQLLRDSDSRHHQYISRWRFYYSR